MNISCLFFISLFISISHDALTLFTNNVICTLTLQLMGYLLVPCSSIKYANILMLYTYITYILYFLYNILSYISLKVMKCLQRTYTFHFADYLACCRYMFQIVGFVIILLYLDLNFLFYSNIETTQREQG